MSEPKALIHRALHTARSTPDRPQRSVLLSVFYGTDGLRAVWRLLIFIAILTTFARTAMLVHVSPEKLAAHGLLASAGWWVTHTKALGFILVLIASGLMAVIEGRRVGDYGLPSKNAFPKTFWQGAVIGFAAITSLLLAMRLLGAFKFGAIGLHGAQIAKDAILSGVACLFVGLFEESLFRGYIQFTLTMGLGFWPAAIITSALFGYEHHSNSGETLVGTFSAGAAGLLFCLLLRRTGNLWMPVGFHAAWNWGESYFYGVPNSGGVSSRHLFNASFSGPQWLTGGSVGPEGSWLSLILIVVLYLVIARWMRQVRYPNPTREASC